MASGTWSAGPRCRRSLRSRHRSRHRGHRIPQSHRVQTIRSRCWGCGRSPATLRCSVRSNTIRSCTARSRWVAGSGCHRNRNCFPRCVDWLRNRWRSSRRSRHGSGHRLESRRRRSSSSRWYGCHRRAVRMRRNGPACSAVARNRCWAPRRSQRAQVNSARQHTVHLRTRRGSLPAAGCSRSRKSRSAGLIAACWSRNHCWG